MTLEAPNYTPTPNELLDAIPEMSGSETTLTFMLYYTTHQRGRGVMWFSRKELQSLTGLDLSEVEKALQRAIRKGFVRKHPDEVLAYGLDVEFAP